MNCVGVRPQRRLGKMFSGLAGWCPRLSSATAPQNRCSERETPEIPLIVSSSRRADSCIRLRLDIPNRAAKEGRPPHETGFRSISERQSCQKPGLKAGICSSGGLPDRRVSLRKVWVTIKKTRQRARPFGCRGAQLRRLRPVQEDGGVRFLHGRARQRCGYLSRQIP